MGDKLAISIKVNGQIQLDKIVAYMVKFGFEDMFENSSIGRTYNKGYEYIWIYESDNRSKKFAHSRNDMIKADSVIRADEYGIAIAISQIDAYVKSIRKHIYVNSIYGADAMMAEVCRRTGRLIIGTKFIEYSKLIDILSAIRRSLDNGIYKAELNGVVIDGYYFKLSDIESIISEFNRH